MNEIATIILAAGESKRMGRTKQIMRYHHHTLVRHAVDTALCAELGPVVVVVGASANRVIHEMDGYKVLLAYNALWPLGMRSSIRCGIEAVERHTSQATGAILMTCDQPFVCPETLRHLAATQTQSKPIVASQYAGTLGVPALFPRGLFTRLKMLQHDGAKMLIEEFNSIVAAIDFPAGAIDIDTESDYAQLNA